jgi:hypothetical protein
MGAKKHTPKRKRSIKRTRRVLKQPTHLTVGRYTLCDDV